MCLLNTKKTKKSEFLNQIYVYVSSIISIII